MKFLKNKAKKALMAAVTMSLVMGACGSAMAGLVPFGYTLGQPNGEFKSGSDPSCTPVAEGFNGKWKEGSVYVLIGGYSDDAGVVVQNNTVICLGGEVDNLVGGDGCEANGAINNTVCIGGYIENGKVFTEKGKINYEKACVYGGNSFGKISSGNTVKVMSVGNNIKALDMASIQNLEFYIPKTAINGDTMLTVKNDVPLADKQIKAGVEKGSKLAVGDKVTLIESTDGIIDGFDTAKTGKLEANDFQDFDLTYEVENEKKLNAIIASVPKLKEDNDNSKSPVETQAAGLTMLTTGADMLASQGFDNAASAVAEEASAGGSANTMTPFVAMGGAKSKVKSGSHVDVKGWNLNVGFAKEIENKAGKLLIGPVVEYGKGSYDSYLDNGFHGEGDTKYIGGGVMAKQTNKDGLYYEGSLRIGKLDNDYSAKENHYDSDATYYAAHVGVGKIVKLSEKNSLDYYGKYFYTHQKGDRTVMHTKGTDIDLRFDSVNSNRTRIGGRFTHAMSAKDSIYVGLAWQHEFSGTARATMDGQGTPAPTVKGNTGIMELGWKVNANKNLDLDLGATAYTGKQKGASLNLAMNFKF